MVGNKLIADQLSYDNEEQTGLANQRIPTLNNGQCAAFDAIVNAVKTKSGQTFFHYGPEGTGKTYVYNTVCYFLHGQGKIVICVASSKTASLFLMGGRTSHSTFKIPIEIHEGSTCSIGKHSDLAGVIRAADLVIWDEAPIQHCHIHEAVDRSSRDIRHCEDKPSGGLVVVFDFKQILPVIVNRSRPQIVGAYIQRSRVWQCVKVLKLTENMHVNTNVEAEKHFAKWQLDVGHGIFTNELGSMRLPDQMH